MASLLADRTRVRVIGAGVVAFLVLFGLGLAIAPRGSGEATSGGAVAAAVPATTIEPVAAAAPVSVGTVQALGKLPVLRAPKKQRTSAPAPPRPPRGGGIAPPFSPPPPPAGPPPVPPPPPVGRKCVGAGCDY